MTEANFWDPAIRPGEEVEFGLRVTPNVDTACGTVWSDWSSTSVCYAPPPLEGTFHRAEKGSVI